MEQLIIHFQSSKIADAVWEIVNEFTKTDQEQIIRNVYSPNDIAFNNFSNIKYKYQENGNFLLEIEHNKIEFSSYDVLLVYSFNF